MYPGKVTQLYLSAGQHEIRATHEAKKFFLQVTLQKEIKETKKIIWHLSV